MHTGARVLVASVVCLHLALLLRPQAAAFAQETPAAPRVHPGQTIWVTTSTGRELGGRVLSVSASALEMTAPDGGISMPLGEVRKIEARDSLKNGTRNGAFIGGASLGIYVGLLSYSLRCERDCGADYSAVRDSIEGVTFGVVAGAGAGALAGLLADYLVKGRQVVYAAPSTRSSSWQAWPAVSKNGFTIHASVRW